jgi:hypothetical protein
MAPIVVPVGQVTLTLPNSAPAPHAALPPAVQEGVEPSFV